ncbi:MAG: amidohydrolase, partial [Lactococcus lactis]|nr:amidohydrolase [Lactococcus lactis]
VYPEPSSAGEDFANYQKRAPSVFAFIGSNEQGASGLHFADMVVQDETLKVAVDYYLESAHQLLEHFK